MRKHAEMINAWDDNVELVVFVKTDAGWAKVNPAWKSDSEYFACLPQHADVCEHWLNGGSLQVETPIGMGAKWVDIVDYSDGCRDWHPEHFFMCKHSKHRIKAKREKRWIAKAKDKNILASKSLYMSLSQAQELCGDCEFYEIEVEV